MDTTSWKRSTIADGSLGVTPTAVLSRRVCATTLFSSISTSYILLRCKTGIGRGDNGRPTSREIRLRKRKSAKSKGATDKKKKEAQSLMDVQTTDRLTKPSGEVLLTAISQNKRAPTRGGAQNANARLVSPPSSF